MIKARKTLALFICIFLASVLLEANEIKFEIVKTLGDERETHLFSSIAQVTVNEKKEIFVLDSKEYKVKKYSWDGKFLAEFGIRGKGPGEFISLVGMQLFDNHIYLYDSIGRRLTRVDSDLKKFDCITYNEILDFDNQTYSLKHSPILLEKNKLFGISQRYIPDKGRLFFADLNLKISHTFFCQFPVQYELEEDSKKRYFNLFSHPKACVNHKKKQILVTFEFPCEKVPFYMYDFNGNLIWKTKIPLDERFFFHRPKLERIREDADGTYYVLYILPVGDDYLLRVHEHIKQGKRGKGYSYYWRVSGDGKKISKVNFSKSLFEVVPGGLISGAREKDEILEVLFYKPTIPEL